MVDVIQKDDKFTQALAELATLAFGRTDDVFQTMRFSHLYGPEEFSNTVGFGGWMALLDTGVAQVRHEVEVFEKLKQLNTDMTKITEQQLKDSTDPDLKKLPRVPHYNPKEVDDLIGKFAKYNLAKPPDDPENITVIRNHLWPYNRNLMAGLRFRYIHLALLNGRYATDSRTMKAFIELSQGANLRPKEITTDEGDKKGGFHIGNPFK